MTIQELKQQYDLHNIAAPHEKETCEICKRMRKATENPLADLNGSNFS